MAETSHSDGNRRHQRLRRGLVGALVVLAVVAGGVAHARFTGAKAIGANAFTTSTLAAPSGLTLTGTSPVGLSWTATPSAWATGTNVYRSTSAGGATTLVSQHTPRTVTTFAETRGLGAYYYEVKAYFQNWLSAASNQVVRDSTTFVFGSTTGNTTAAECAIGAQRERDMKLGLVPTDPAETMTRTGGTGTLLFCSDPFLAGEVLTAGTTTVDAYVINTSGSTCAISATLLKNSTTLLGNGSITIPANSALQLRTWSFATTGFTATSTDRLTLYLTWQGVKACDSTDLYYDGAATPSSVTVPPITGA